MTANALRTRFTLGRSLILLGSVAVPGLSGCADAGSEGTRSQTAESSLSAAKAEELPFTEPSSSSSTTPRRETLGSRVSSMGSWKELTLRGPDGGTVLRVEPRGQLKALGLTELFFETDEPSNEDVPIDELLAMLPAGQYEYEGKSVDVG